MSGRTDSVTPRMLREWRLPEPGSSKYERGRIVVVGGSVHSPGAAQLCGLAAMRVGAGRLTLGVADAAAVGLAVVTPEAGVYGLATSDSGSVRGTDLSVLASELEKADAVVVGPGLDDPEATEHLLRGLLPMLGDRTLLVVDAFALGSLPQLGTELEPLAGRLVLTPNDSEAELLLGRPLDDVTEDSASLAQRFHGVVACHDVIADPDHGSWRIETGHSGLATSGSGDVLSGVVGGLLARGATPSQAACWGKYVHASAGERLAARVGRLGFLAREILPELPAVLTELDA